MQHALQSQECYFFLLKPYTDLIDKNLPASPNKGARLHLNPTNPECNWIVTIEVDSGGILTNMTVQDIRSPDISLWHWDFNNEVFTNCSDELDLICGHPLFHVFQHIIPAHFSAGNYTVTTTTL